MFKRRNQKRLSVERLQAREMLAADFGLGSIDIGPPQPAEHAPAEYSIYQENGGAWQVTPPELNLPEVDIQLPEIGELSAPENAGDREVPRMTEQQRENVKNLVHGLIGLRRESDVSARDVQLFRDVFQVVQNAQRPDEVLVEAFRTQLKAATSDDDGLTVEEAIALYPAMHAVLEDANLTWDHIKPVVHDLREMWEGGIDPSELLVLVEDVQAIREEFDANHGTPVADEFLNRLENGETRLSEQQEKNVLELWADIEAIRKDSGVTDEMIEQLKTDVDALRAALSDDDPPSTDEVDEFVGDLQEALNDGLTLVEKGQLVVAFHKLVRGDDAEEDAVDWFQTVKPLGEAVISDLQTIYQAADISQQEREELYADLQAIADEFANTHGDTAYADGVDEIFAGVGQRSF